MRVFFGRLVLCAVFGSMAFGQNAAPKDKDAAAPGESAELRAARHSFMLVSTRAIAAFHSADTIKARLEADGATLRPSTTALRLRIEHTLDQAEADLNRPDMTRAGEHIKAAEELVGRFERRIGAE